ncbi:hypothetical protein D3093_27595 (plasmid) [Azospirillum argentinense]|uniref:Uncharacterized protein n=2 Tax=Azospirillum TaxID=191 RepID=A0A4D8QCV6_AZOBR|nr:hypothetical protein D3093_27595 [Azospirillum argentinense]QCO06756.1 hypothetical protein D3867_33095 [Azospirillum argentinense]
MTRGAQHFRTVSKHCDIVAERLPMGPKRSMEFSPIDRLLQPRDIFLSACGGPCDGIPRCQVVAPGPQ